MYLSRTSHIKARKTLKRPTYFQSHLSLQNLISPLNRPCWTYPPKLIGQAILLFFLIKVIKLGLSGNRRIFCSEGLWACLCVSLGSCGTEEIVGTSLIPGVHAWLIPTISRVVLCDWEICLGSTSTHHVGIYCLKFCYKIFNIFSFFSVVIPFHCSYSIYIPSLLRSTVAWWMRWTSQAWSWTKHWGNFRPTSVSREKPRRWNVLLRPSGN